MSASPANPDQFDNSDQSDAVHRGGGKQIGTLVRLAPWVLCGVLGWALLSAKTERAERDRLVEELAEARDRVGAQDRQLLHVEDELRQALQREQGMAERLAEHLAELERERDARAAALRAARRPMPEGVQLVLQELHRRMAGDGHNAVRFLRAEGLKDRRLLNVEAVLVGPFGVKVEAVLAEEVEVHLDRGAALARCIFRGGYRVVDGEEQPLPEEGHVVELDAVDVAAWEERLPALVRATGVATPAAMVTRPSGLDPAARREWVSALDAVLAGASDGVRYRIRGLEDLLDGEFRVVGIAGYDSDGMLAFRAEAERLVVEVDPQGGGVQVVLRGGVLHRRSGQATIPAEGYRIRLPGIGAERARDLMLGVVQTR